MNILCFLKIMSLLLTKLQFTSYLHRAIAKVICVLVIVNNSVSKVFLKIMNLL